MALWQVKDEVVFSDGALSISAEELSGVFVKRHFYKVPYTNVGKGGILRTNGKTYHTPSWTEVHPDTTVDDIIVEKKPFEEVFVEQKSWSFKSASSDKEYTVKLKRDGQPYCDCWGYMGHKNCKHIKEVKKELELI
jgi:hypothetical protein|tara:strand:+ start:1520 stop:1927 length:408 start_codon:yes stop_codon:yes gene_type:complete